MTREDREKLFHDNVKLAYYILNKLCITSKDYEDCLQEALLGLWCATNKYDPNKSDAKFSTYATHSIMNQVFKYLSNKSYLIKLPASVHKKIIEINKYIKNNPEYAEEDLIKYLGITPQEYKEINNNLNIRSLSDTIYSGDKGKNVMLEDLVPDMEDIVSYNMTKDVLIELKDKVTKDYKPAHKQVYDDYFEHLLQGLIITQDCLSKKYGVDQARVSRIIKRTTIKIREEFSKCQ